MAFDDQESPTCTSAMPQDARLMASDRSNMVSAGTNMLIPSRRTHVGWCAPPRAARRAHAGARKRASRRTGKGGAAASTSGSSAQERVTAGPDGLVRMALKRPFADGTVAIDLDPLSLLARLAASVPAKGTHTVRYAGVLASASRLRSRVVPSPPAAAPAPGGEESKPDKRGCRYLLSA